MLWARTMLAALVGGLEVPGGTLGTTVRLNRPLSERLDSVQAGSRRLHGVSDQSDRQGALVAEPEHPQRLPDDGAARRPTVRGARRSGPTHFSWMFLDETPKGLPRVTLPDVWFVYRTNPAISFWDTEARRRQDGALPVHGRVRLHARRDQSHADILLPEATDLESLQLIRIGGSKYVEQFWDAPGLRAAPAGGRRRRARRATSPTIATELARRTGLLEKYNAVDQQRRRRRAAQGRALGLRARRRRRAHTPRRDLGRRLPRRERRADRRRARSHGLAWWKEHGLATKPFPRTEWYLYPTLVEQGLRFELPYQERLLRIGTELGRRLHEHDMHWWDEQLAEYQALPVWKDFAAPWETAVARAGRRQARRTIRSGCSPRAACSTRGAATSACS